MNSNVKTAVVWLGSVGMVILGWAVFKQNKATSYAQPNFSDLVKQVEAGKVESVTINATGDVHGKYKDGGEFRSTVPPTYNDFTTLLLEKGVSYTSQKESGNQWVSIVVNAIPFVLL